MSGYTPLFASIVTGTLYGRWPDIGLWAIVLAIADWRGTVDVTPQYLSGATGLPIPDVVDCMRRFCQPDPHSRSKAEQGARLALIDPQREWGWRIVNIQLYRDKASGLDQVSDGRNREKVRRYKDRHRETPEDTGGHRETPTHTHTHTQTKTEELDKSAARSQKATRFPADFELSESRKETARAEGVDPERTFAGFRDYWLAASGANARKHDWDATWRNWCRKASDFKPRNGAAKKPYVSPLTLEQVEEAERLGLSAQEYLEKSHARAG